MAGERRAHWLAEVVSTCLLWETAQRNEWAAVPRCQAAQVMRLPAELEKTGPSAFCSSLFSWSSSAPVSQPPRSCCGQGPCYLKSCSWLGLAAYPLGEDGAQALIRTQPELAANREALHCSVWAHFNCSSWGYPVEDEVRC